MVDPIKPENLTELSDLELQLLQVRAKAREARFEAQAARLEAHAARLETMAARLERFLRSHTAEGNQRGGAKETPPFYRDEPLGGETGNGVEGGACASALSPGGSSSIGSESPEDETHRWPRSWDEILVRRTSSRDTSSGPLQEASLRGGQGGSSHGQAALVGGCREGKAFSSVEAEAHVGAEGPSCPGWSASSLGTAERIGDQEDVQEDVQEERARNSEPGGDAEQREQADVQRSMKRSLRKSQEEGDWPVDDFLKDWDEPGTQTPPFAAISTADTTRSLKNAKSEEGGVSKRRRPAALGISLGLHAIVLVVFAGITLTAQVPRDAMVLSASQADDRFEMQVAEFESVVIAETPVLDTPEVPRSQSIEALAELTKASDLVLPVSSSPALSPTAIPSPSLGARSLLGDSGLADSIPQDVSTQFFGLEGGGNTFVYLVDSSRSMDDVSRDGFDVARNELLRAVDQLNERQKFYVMFFGEETWEMPTGDQGDGSPRLVSASRESKETLRRWALSLQMQPGAWPREALQIAFKLRPDCIFLLTDGAMSENVIPLVRQENIVNTLFDGPKPRSIIHTIGFHNPEGEARLREIANLSGGAYRFVPPTRNARR